MATFPSARLKNSWDFLIRELMTFISKAGDKQMTLKEVFEALNVTAYDLTVDMLDVHAVRKTSFLFKHGNTK